MVLTALTLLDQREEREIVSKIFKLQTLCAKLDCGGRPNDLVHCMYIVNDFSIKFNIAFTIESAFTIFLQIVWLDD